MREITFYEDQLSKRECRLSEEIDVEFETEKENTLEAEKGRLEEEMENERFAFQDNDEVIDLNSSGNKASNLNCSLNRSGLTRITVETVDDETQTDACKISNWPKIRKVCDCTYEIKSTCVEVSVKCNVSAAIHQDKQCRQFAEEAINNDSELSECMSSIEESIPRKKMRLQEDAKKESIPVTKDEYKPYENVLPSLRTIVEYKQLLSA